MITDTHKAEKIAQLKKDPLFISIQQKRHVPQYVHEEQKNNKDAVLILVRQNGYLLRYVSEELQNDKEVVLAAVQEFGCALEFASSEIKDDKEFILAAIQHDDLAFGFASKELKNNKEVALAAVRKYSLARDYADPSLKPFLSAYIELKSTIEWHSDPSMYRTELVVKKRAEKLLLQSEKLFLEGKVPQEQLTEALIKAHELIQNPHNNHIIREYNQISEQAMKNQHPGMQLFGKMMMALSVVVVAVGATLAMTGIGAAPGAAVGLIGLGLFAGGAELNKDKKKTDEEVVRELLKPCLA